MNSNDKSEPFELLTLASSTSGKSKAQRLTGAQGLRIVQRAHFNHLSLPFRAQNDRPCESAKYTGKIHGNGVKNFARIPQLSQHRTHVKRTSEDLHEQCRP